MTGRAITDSLIAQTRYIRRSAHCYPLSRAATRPSLPPLRGQTSSRYKSSKHPSCTVRKGQAGGLWCRCSADEYQIAAQHFCWHTLLDGTGSHSTSRARLQGRHMVIGNNSNGANTRRAPSCQHTPDEGALLDSKGLCAATGRKQL